MKLKIAVWALILLTSFTVFSGCSSVKFYEPKVSDSADVGFLYYPSKPYILIEKGEKGLVTKLISLPDTSRPHRVKYSGGWGSAEMGFEIENGMIKKFNSKTDSKTPETITALTGFATAKAAIMTAKAALMEVQKVTDPAKLSILTIPTGQNAYTVKVIDESIVIIQSNVVAVLSSSPSPTDFANPLSRLNKQIANLSTMKTITYADGDTDSLVSQLESFREKTHDVITQLKSIGRVLKIIGSDSKNFSDSFSYAIEGNENLTIVIEKLSDFYNRSTSIEGLWEIDYTSGQLYLRKVIF